MASPSFSSVVSGLVRASLGSTVSASVSDEDLDRHVRELILKEAKEKEEKYLGTAGMRAYVPESEPTSKPKPNKRFLNAIIRDVDQHNAVVIQSQAQAAATAKQKEEEEARQIRKARAEEASADRMRRLMGGNLRRDRDRESSDRRRRDEAESSRSKDVSRYDEPGPSGSRRDERDWSPTLGRKGKRRSRDDDDEEAHSTDDRYSSRRGGRDRKERRQDYSDDDSDRRRHRRSTRRSRSRSPDSDSRRKRSRRDEGSRRSASPQRERHRNLGEDRRSNPAERDERDRRRSETSSRREHRSHQESPVEDTKLKRSHPLSQSLGPDELQTERPRSPSPPTPTRPPEHIPSKMDKYFDPAYDPILDVDTAAMGSLNELVPEGGFEHWNAMLELVKQRKEDKADKKRKEKEEGKKKKKRKDRGEEEDEEEEHKRKIKLGLEVPGLMDIKYAKRGAMREWDVGKEVT